MSLRFTCPHCGVTADVPDQFSGQSGPCAKCGQPITIPPIAGTSGYPTSTKGSGAAVVVVVVLALVAGLLILCTGVGGVFFWAIRMPFVGPPPPPPMTTSQWFEAPDLACSDNLRRIGQAMNSYHDAHGSFPPAYLADDEGRPTHSWRALLLPYLDEPDLSEQYDFEEPWDGPSNRNLLSSRPDVFHCPNDVAAAGSDTNYLMIVGRNTISDGAGSCRLAEITDGSAFTLLVVEVSGSGIAWSEPADLDAEAITYLVNDGSPEGIRGGAHTDGGAYALFCDGSVRTLSDELAAEVIEAWSTPAGGEPRQTP